MHFVEKEPSQKRIDFVDKLKSNKILRVPGAYNPLTAKLIEEIGYDAIYVSGGVMANDLGFPSHHTKHKLHRSQFLRLVLQLMDYKRLVLLEFYLILIYQQNLFFFDLVLFQQSALKYSFFYISF